MRRYGHEPDQAWIERRYASKAGRLHIIRDTVERVGRGMDDLDAFDVAVLSVLEIVSYGWALGEPVDNLRTMLGEAAGWVDEALGRSRELEGMVAQRSLVAATMARAWAVAEGVAAMVPDGVVDFFEERGPVAGGFLMGLANLVGGNGEAAAAAAARMRDAAADPKVPPHELDAYAHVHEIIAATAAGDEAELAAAVEQRSAWLAQEYGTSIENRRDRSGLLDLPGTAVVACAVRSGLRPRVGTDYVAVELVGGG